MICHCCSLPVVDSKYDTFANDKTIRNSAAQVLDETTVLMKTLIRAVA